MVLELDRYHIGDALELARQLPDESVNCIVTSPPYWGLRDYGLPDAWGLEPTLAEYVERITSLFSELRRTLTGDGTLWLNLGDSYISSGKNRTKAQATAKSTLHGGLDSQCASLKQISKLTGELKQKDLAGVPWRVALALQADGWYLRQDIIWHKPNPMPESVRDRCTKAHEYLFMLSKTSKYFYCADAIKEPCVLGDYKTPDGWDTALGSHGTIHRKGREKGEKKDKQRGHSRRHAGFNDRWDRMTKEEQCSGMRNKRDVWTIATHPYPDAHFATFPLKLIEPCILAGCPEDSVVLDPFLGTGTVAEAAIRHRRKWIGFEINPDYTKLIDKRLRAVQTALKV